VAFTVVGLAILGVIVGIFIYKRPPAEVREFARLTEARQYKSAFALLETDFSLLIGDSEWWELKFYLRGPAQPLRPGFEQLPTGRKLTILLQHAAVPSSLDCGRLDDASLFDGLCRNVYARYGLFDHGFKLRAFGPATNGPKRKVIPISFQDQPTRWFLVEVPHCGRKIAFASIAYAFDDLITTALRDSGKSEERFLHDETARLMR